MSGFFGIFRAKNAHGEAKTRWREWTKRTALAAVAVSLGLGGGAVWAYFTSTGSGTGSASTGGAVSMTVNATTGTADLLPGGMGAVYFTLNNSSGSLGATFNKVVTGATVISNDTNNCPTANISIAQTLPYTFSPAVSVGAHTTSGTQSIANLVQLANNAPSTCQGVTFTVTLTLSGQST